MIRLDDRELSAQPNAWFMAESQAQCIPFF